MLNTGNDPEREDSAPNSSADADKGAAPITPRTEQAQPAKQQAKAESIDYVVPEAIYQKHPERFSTHTGKTKNVTEEDVANAEAGFVFANLGENDKWRRKHRHHHHHHHSSSSSGISKEKMRSFTEAVKRSNSTDVKAGESEHHHHHHHHSSSASADSAESRQSVSTTSEQPDSAGDKVAAASEHHHHHHHHSSSASADSGESRQSVSPTSEQPDSAGEKVAAESEHHHHHHHHSSSASADSGESRQSVSTTSEQPDSAGDKVAAESEHHHHHHHHSSSASADSGESRQSVSTTSEQPVSTAGKQPERAAVKAAAASAQRRPRSADELDVIVDEGENRHHHHHHHHHHSSSSGKKHRRSRKKRRKMALWLKILIIVVSVILAIVIALAGTFFILREIGRKALHNYENISIVTPTEEESGEELIEVADRGRNIVYEDTTYALNEDVICIAFVGVDHDIDNNIVQSMADSNNLIAIDVSTGKTSIISVSRDTMTDVNLYSDEGKYIDTEIMQLTYAYSFGNEHISGGANTAVSLSRLFYGLSVNNYFAINMDALVDLNDAIGGVTLTSSFDFTSPIDGRMIYAGETVTLHGKEADRYVRSRDMTNVAGNNDRVKRQQEYISAFMKQVFPVIKKDLSTVTKLYDIIRVNADTNLDLPKITYLASEMITKMDSVSAIEYLTLQGEVVKGEEHAEFYADDKNVLETMLKVFYKPVE